jgi:ribosomal protein L10
MKTKQINNLDKSTITSKTRQQITASQALLYASFQNLNAANLQYTNILFITR